MFWPLNHVQNGHDLFEGQNITGLMCTGGMYVDGEKSCSILCVYIYVCMYVYIFVDRKKSYSTLCVYIYVCRYEYILLDRKKLFGTLYV